MASITKNELLKLAKQSHMAIDEHEVDHLINALQDVLSYAERVKELAHLELDVIASKNVNVTRPDQQAPVDSAAILAAAPVVEERFFVVPTIVTKSEGAL